MSKVILRKNNRERRKLRVKQKITGTTQKPRLTIFRSNKYVYGQIIDDIKGTTVCAVTLIEVQDAHKGKVKKDASFEIGKILAAKALTKKIKQVVFDRNGYRYHGRVARLAEGAREGGLKL